MSDTLPLWPGDHPPRNGSYVAYTNDVGRVLLTYVSGQWYYPLSDQRFRESIRGFVGPLPPLVERNRG